MFVKANAENAFDYKITSNGIQIHGCIWFDTNEGIAACHYTIPLRTGIHYPLVVFDMDEYTTARDAEEYAAPTYYLHTFEIIDARTGQQIAKV